MRVQTKKTEEEVRRDLFGPIQEASKEPYQLQADPRKSWCELSELRLSILLCRFKPVGYNRNFHLLAIVDHMCKIYDNERAQSEIFLSEEDKVRFRDQQRRVLMGGCDGDETRLAFPPTYLCRPSLEVVEKKINEWFGLEKCEENESVPELMTDAEDFKLPIRVSGETSSRESTSSSERGSGVPPVPAPQTNRKKRIIKKD